MRLYSTNKNRTPFIDSALFLQLVFVKLVTRFLVFAYEQVMWYNHSYLLTLSEGFRSVFFQGNVNLFVMILCSETCVSTMHDFTLLKIDKNAPTFPSCPPAFLSLKQAFLEVLCNITLYRTPFTTLLLTSSLLPTRFWGSQR